MMPSPLTLQIFHHQQWHDAAELSFADDFRCTRLDYLNGYIFQEDNGNYLTYEKDDAYAVSLNYPVNLNSYTHSFAFLDDLIPSGASRRYWLQHLDLSRLPEKQQDYLLLQHATIAPVGNMRIKQAVPEEAALRTFPAEQVINRQTDFLEYAQANGAIAGGATGAGGEAPKLLLRQNPQGEVWIDNQQNATANDTYYLVKYPRNRRTPIDCDILRAEFHFYHELNDLGFDTININQMKLLEGEHYPSLWLPRFDVAIFDDKTERYALESVYSLLQRGAGSYLNHGDCVRQLIDLMQHSHTVQEQKFELNIQEFIKNWLQRDLLNIAFGNSDNHGRNTAFLRGSGSLKLAPIYDFAPMKADPEGIARTTTWGKPLENGGEYDFPAIVQIFDDMVDSALLLSQLQQTAQQLLDLKTRLQQRGVPLSILNMPVLGYDYLADKFQRWGLL